MLAATLGLSRLFVTGAFAQPSRSPRPTIVLVHGAFADASSWNPVVKRLQAEGYPVLAPANPLRGLASATGNPNVKALVYVAAYIPDVGQALGELGTPQGGAEVGPNMLRVRPCPDAPGCAEGYIKLDVFHDIFAADVSAQKARTMAAEQRPLSVSAYALVPNQDRAIGTANELAMARHAGAQVTRINGSHVVMLSHPDAVLQLVDSAAAKFASR